MTKKKCKICKKKLDPSKPDPCFGMLPGVKFACCGHGEKDGGYISFENGIAIYFNTESIIDWSTFDKSMVEDDVIGVYRSKMKHIEFKDDKNDNT